MSQGVSVVIPAYNAARFIEDSISSVLSQTYKPLEIIVVDDGSRDETRTIVERHAKDVRYIYQDNAGPSAARNHGVREARGDWVAFLDSDDYWEPDHLESLIKHAQLHADVVLVYCGKKIVDAQGKRLDRFKNQTQFPSGWIFSELLFANYISSCSVVMAKRSILLDVGGFNTDIKNSEDYHLWLRIAAIAPIIGIPSYTVNYRIHDSNLTLQTLAQVRGHMTALYHAASLVDAGRVDGRNETSEYIVRKALKNYYRESAAIMFYLREYVALRRLCLEALNDGYFTHSLLKQLSLSCVPRPILSWGKSCFLSIKRIIS